MASFPEPLQWNGDDPGPRKEYADPESKPSHICDRPGCDRELNFFAVYAPIGGFCSRKCYDTVQAAFDEHMKRDGHMTATGERS